MRYRKLRLKGLIFLLLAVSMALQGQGRSPVDRMLSKARAAWERRDYGTAMLQATHILKKDPAHLNALLLMADVYHELDSTEAEAVYLRRAADTGKGSPLVDYRLGEACFKTASYGESLERLDRFLQTAAPGTLRQKALALRASAVFAASAVKDPLDFNPIPLGDAVNSGLDEYWPSLTVDGNLLVFTRLLPVSGSGAFRQEDFYMSRRDSSGWQPATPLTDLNTPLNEGAQSVSADGKLLFFTLCNHPQGYGSCDIWFTRQEEGRWTPPVNAGPAINTPGWEGQPSFSAFGGHLFFSSSRPGGKGRKDLWMTTLKGWGPMGFPLWEEPVNLGDSINTPGDEISPFIHANGRDLYFASDEWPGLGGYDLFRSQWQPGHSFTTPENRGHSFTTPENRGLTFTTPVNLGYPLNSPGNEQGLIVDRSGETGYFSSNLQKGGDMELYAFPIDEKIRPSAVTFLRGRVVNAMTRQPVAANVSITGTGPMPFPEITLRSDGRGIFLVTLPPEKEMVFSVSEPGYLFYSEWFRFDGASSLADPVEREIALEPALPGKTMDLYNLFFATNEFAVLPASEPELQILLGFLKQNPALRVEIGGHTDNIGSAEFNRILSKKRAESVRKYLTDRGIGEMRLSARGYGMDQPVASNDAEEGRSRNRRTTIKIVE